MIRPASGAISQKIGSIGTTSRKLTAIVIAMPTPTQPALMAPRSTNRLMQELQVRALMGCAAARSRLAARARVTIPRERREAAGNDESGAGRSNPAGAAGQREC